MALYINVFNSCKFLAITATRYDDSATSADIKITNVDGDSPGEYTAAMNYDTGTGRGKINIPTNTLNFIISKFSLLLLKRNLTHIIMLQKTLNPFPNAVFHPSFSSLYSLK